MRTVFLNDQFLPQNQAVISVMDRGFLFGDGVYEVIPVYQGKLFRFEHHFYRLKKSLEAIKLPIDLDTAAWEKNLTKLIDLNKHQGPNQSIYLQITRGPTDERSHAFPSQTSPTFLSFTMPLNPIPLEELSKGKRAITLDDTRWQFCYIKSISLLANILLYQQALDANAAEAILIKNSEVTEGSTSNVFIVKNHIIKTPPLSDYILGGVTRDLVLELAHQNGLPCEETIITEEELHSADEIWITSSTREIYPIVYLNESPVNTGQPGSVWETMIRLYRDFIQKI